MEQTLERQNGEQLVDNLDVMFLFIEAGVNALNKIGGYGETSFICPWCGGKAKISKIRCRTRAWVWAECYDCNARLIS